MPVKPYLWEWEDQIRALHSDGLGNKALASEISATAGRRVPPNTLSNFLRQHLHLEPNPRDYSPQPEVTIHEVYTKPWIEDTEI